MHVLYEVKDLLEKELNEIVVKGDISPQDLDKIKDASESIYYITAACVMAEESEYSGRMYPVYSNRGMMSGNYYNDGRRGRDADRDGWYNESSGRRDSRGRYSRDNYSRHDLDSKREYLEEMMNEARSESEREAFRKKLDELNRQMM